MRTKETLPIQNSENNSSKGLLYLMYSLALLVLILFIFGLATVLR